MNVFDIKEPKDIKSLNIDELKCLSNDIRKFLIESISKTGGHLSSNLGIVELCIALHYVFDSPNDKMIFDVGHQSYVHKILTGRINEFVHLREYKGISGFQKRIESIHDPWEAGHSSTSLSAAHGMCVARDLNHEKYQVIPVIGDGALSGGMAMEALNQIGCEQRNLIIIFNDNNMSISQNVGAMDEAFTKLRTSKPYTTLKMDMKHSLSKSNVGKNILQVMTSMKNRVKDNVVDTSIFGEFHLDYIGPIDGHDLKTLIKVLNSIKNHEGPIVVHVLTQKGKGYPYAEQDKEGKWHGVGPFDIASGKSLSQMPQGYASWSEIISSTLEELASVQKDIVAITPAMKSGSKLSHFFERYPDRSFDCGIAEEHAMTFAAGLATSGKKPFVSIYSSFLQRAYDQISHDVARMDLPVVIGIDRAGLVGEDGETHHGIYDISMLRHIPNIILCQPKDAIEAQNLLYTAFKQFHPFAIRYPRGNTQFKKLKQYECIEIGSWVSIYKHENAKLCVIAYGESVDRIVSKAIVNHYEIEVINARFFKPIDTAMIRDLANTYADIIVYESDILIGGLSSAILEYICDHQLQTKIHRMGIQDQFVTHGSIPILKKTQQIDLQSLCNMIQKILQGE